MKRRNKYFRSAENRIPSACILAIPMLYVRPSSYPNLKDVSNSLSVSWCVGQDRLFEQVGSVWGLCALQMCLTWCVDYFIFKRSPA
jgi:hypothetical protein